MVVYIHEAKQGRRPAIFLQSGLTVNTTVTIAKLISFLKNKQISLLFVLIQKGFCKPLRGCTDSNFCYSLSTNSAVTVLFEKFS